MTRLRSSWRRPTPALAVVLLVALAPAGAAGRSDGRCTAQDEFVALAHGDGGGVWIPREVGCGGEAPLILVLHGGNPDRISHESGGDRGLSKLARRLIDQRRARPVMLAEPVHFRSCRTGLYDERFDFAAYRIKLETALAVRHIRVTSYAVIAHSGAGCCGGVHRAARAFGKVGLLGLIDVCYGQPVYAAAVHEGYDDATVVLSISRGEGVYDGYPRFESSILGRHPLAVSCDRSLYRQCLRSSDRPAYAFTTTRRGAPYHSVIVSEVMPTVLTQFFPPAPPTRVALPILDTAAAVARPEPRILARTAGAARLWFAITRAADDR